MYVKPNRPTPDPERGGYLADAGRTVEATPYWLRRLADGDVREADPPAHEPEPPPRAPDQAHAAAPAQEPAAAGSVVSGPRTSSKSSKGPQP
jgi:hypothetical protein